MKTFLPIICLALLGACTSVGVKVDQSKLADFKKGKTTYSEVVQSLGQPTQTMITDNGGKTIMYAYYGGQPRPESFIPYVGLAVGGADVETSSVTMTFDRKDILRSYSSTSGAMGAGTGFEAYSQPRKSQQPNQIQ
jgi:outer membrane protein assembly factor BamE (lipoprotein component of BamABCDE complex)